VTVTVEFGDAEPNGLATMMGGIIQANLEAHPERESLLDRVTTYSIRASDIDVAVSIRLSPGRVQVRNGVVGRPSVRIESDSNTLVGLSGVPLRFGLPDVTRKEGREVLRSVGKRRLRVRGLVAHPRALGRLNKLLSVV
jgi:hypothetical protein